MTPAITTGVAATTDSAKRDAILAAALDLFSRETFEGARVPAIADAAGVGAGTIYRYFDSKEALVNALYRHWKGALADALLDAVDETMSPRAMVGAFWRALWRFASDHPQAFAFLETHHHAPYLDDASRAAGAAMGAAMSAHIVRMQATGEVRDLDPAVLSALVFGAFTGIVKATLATGLPQDESLIAATESAAWALVAREGTTDAHR